MKHCQFIQQVVIIIFLTVLVLGNVTVFHSIAFADNSAQYVPANYYPISATKVQEGNIVAFSDGQYILSKVAYDQFMVGVVTANPAITQDIQGPIPSYPVINAGQGFVLVTTGNGEIKKGDFITSSTIPGIGMKATKSGYTIGVALEGFNAKNTKTIGKIPISINIHYFIGNAPITSNLLDLLTLSAVATYESPSLVFKYILSGGIVALSLLFAFVLISKTANKGIDALGRNPLSSTDIHIGIALNVFIAVILLITGGIMGYLVLRL